MVDKTKKSGRQKRSRISEEDVFCVLQRYSATTILALLQEVGQFEGVKIDWSAIVKKTSTGISNAREYQMLWRHLAYRHSLSEKLNDNDQLLEDDSDLECELEPCPEVSAEASADAAASVKVLMASALSNDIRATTETLQPFASQGMSSTASVSVQKQQLPALTGSEGKDGDGAQIGNLQPRKKRKTWSDAKDMELIAAVRKFGEGNWNGIVKSQIMGDSTAHQLSQRWASIRKKNNLNLGTNSRNTQLTEAQQAARHAVNMALDPQARTTFINRTAGQAFGNGSVPRPSSNECLPSKHEPQKHPSIMRYSLSMASAIKLPDPVRATAVVAGARIYGQKDAALLKLTQANSVVHHIMPKGSTSIRTPVFAGASTRPKVHPLSAGVASSSLSTSSSDPKNVASSKVQRPRPTLSSQPKKVSSAKTVKASSSSGTATATAVVQEDGGCRVEQVMVDDKTANLEGNNKSKMVVAEKTGPLPEKETVENGKVAPLNKKPQGTLKESDNNGGSCSADHDCKDKDENRVNKQQSDDGGPSEKVVKVNDNNKKSEPEEKEAVKL
ncbi:hypothetical protein LINGRAHAP2_LOCUS32764 [Linum grandiflorum]